MSIFDKEIIKTQPLSDIVKLDFVWGGTKVELEEDINNYIGTEVVYHRNRREPKSYTCCDAVVVNRYPIETKSIPICELFLPDSSIEVKVTNEVVEPCPRLIMSLNDMLYEGSLFEVDTILTPPNVKMEDFGDYVTNAIARNILNKVQKFNTVRLGLNTGIQQMSPWVCTSRIELLWIQWYDSILMSPTSNCITRNDQTQEYLWRGFHDKQSVYCPDSVYDVDPVHIYLDFKIILKEKFLKN